MPSPSEQARFCAIDRARRVIALEIVRRYESRLKNGVVEPGVFTVRLAPNQAQCRMGRTGVGGYDPRDYASRDAFRCAADDFGKACAIDMLKFDGAGAVESMRVNDAVVDYAYGLLGGRPAHDEIARRVLECADKTAKAPRLPLWAKRWLDVQAEEIRQTPVLAKERWGDGAERFDALCRALYVYASLEKPIRKRVLSVRAFGDSKRFENEIAASFVKAAAEGGFIFEDGSDIDEKLYALGFETAKECAVFIGGNVSIDFSFGLIDVGKAGFDGIALPLPALAGIDSRALGKVRACLAIENVAAYRDVNEHAPRGLLTVCGHGMFDALRLDLIRRLDEALPADAQFLVWSDIDKGGFAILDAAMGASNRIRPFMMDVEAMRLVDSACLLKRPDEYWARMGAYLEKHPDTCFREVALMCLDSKGTLEQEALLGAYAYEKIAHLVS